MIEKKYLKIKILYIFSLKLPFTRIFLFYLFYIVLHIIGIVAFPCQHLCYTCTERTLDVEVISKT